MSEQRDVAAEFMTATGGRATAPPASNAAASAAAPVSVGAPATPAIEALNADPAHLAALHDEDSPGHKQAVMLRRQAFEAHYGTEPATIEGASSDPQIIEREDGSYGLTEPPTADEMDAVAVRAASLAIAGQGVDPELAATFGQRATEIGLNAVEVADLAQEIASSNYRSQEAGIASLGSESGRMVARAQAVVHKLGIKQELLDISVSEHLALGDHPAFIKAMNNLGLRMGL